MIPEIVSIDRKIGKTDARMSEVKQIPEETAKPPVPRVRPQGRIPSQRRERYSKAAPDVCTKSTTGSFFPRLPNGKRKKFNVYAETREQAEIKLAEMIERVKAETKSTLPWSSEAVSYSVKNHCG